MTRLSILAMSFNRPAGLRLAIDSVRAQTFGEWELLICDDASTDPRVLQVVRSYKDTRIRVIPNPIKYAADEREKVNTLGRRLNDGIATLGDYVEFVSYIGDGITYAPQRCERLIAHLENHADADAAWGVQVTETYQDGQLVAATEHKVGGAHREFPGQVLVQNLGQQNMIDHCSVVERADIARQFPWTLDPAQWRTPDWERWRRIASAGKRMDFVPQIGESKRTGQSNLGVMMRRGASITDVVAARSKAAKEG